ncbi:MAG: ribose transport system ATP-binding protein [Thermoleophilaceae bacterium]|nr:ribose transport system ATP-binding protein [Thermoleophilaceae bacterium]
MTAPLLRMRGVHKSFSGVEVLRDVDFELRAGEVHALLGGNGAGKSTLMKILEGVYSLDSGSIEVDGESIRLRTPQDARRHGVAMIFQEFSLIPTLTVAQNVFLHREPRKRGGMLDDRKMIEQSRALFADMGVDIEPTRRVSALGTAGWQLVEIAKALSQDARILIMDEPTASLAAAEVESLFAIIDRLKSRGIGIVFITHRLEEVIAVADRVTALRDGARVGTHDTSELDMSSLIELIVGHAVERSLQERPAPVTREGTPLLSLRGVSSGDRLHGVDLDLHEGEVLGIAGLMGSGRSELARAVFGIDKISSGTVEVRGKPVALRRPKDAIAHGIALVPEDRRRQGLVLGHNVKDNLTVTLLNRLSHAGFVNDGELERAARAEVDRLDIKLRSLRSPVRRLSGGNQQKVVLSKWLATSPDVLILDEPTVGVDIATRSEIVQLVRGLAAEGKGIIVISSELAELLALADRLLVMREGRVHRTVERSEVGSEPELHRLVQEQAA